MKNELKERALFESAPIMQAILKLALPTVIGQIIGVIYNMADTFFIGQTGSEVMVTSVTICMPAFMFLTAISNLFGVGGSSVISRALGQGRNDRAKNAAAFAMWGCLVVTALYALLALLFRDTFMNLLGGTHEQVHIHAVRYLMVTVVICGIGTTMSNLLAHLVRSEGRSLQASVGIGLGGILNIALDPLFMFVILKPGNEVLGAAIATGLSNIISMIYFICILYRDRNKMVISFTPSKAMMQDGLPVDILSIGLPACLMTLCENISYAVLDNLMSTHGIIMQAGIGVAKKVNMLAHCMVRGMAQGVLPLIGYNFASGNHRRMRQAVLISTTISVCLATVCMVISLAFSEPLIGLFIQNGTDSVVYGAKFLRILCIGGPFSACAYAFISFFQATGNGLRSFVLAILRKGVLDIPMMFILNGIIPIFGIVWATPIADIVCCIIAIILFVEFLKNRTNLMDDSVGLEYDD